MQNQLITKWLDEVCTGILRPSYRKRVRKELSDHINDRIRQLENDGMNHDDAVTEALCLMGDPEKLAQAFAKCDHSFLPIRKILSTVIIWLTILILLIYLIAKITQFN